MDSKKKYDNDGFYYKDFVSYFENHSYIEINSEVKSFKNYICLDYVAIDNFQEAVNLLFDLFQAGLVEKVHTYPEVKELEDFVKVLEDLLKKELFKEK